MPELINPLFAAGQFLVEQRWAGTAVLDNAGNWHVVREL